MVLTRTEALYLAAFLNELGSRFSTDGCNDITLPDTKENRLLLASAEESTPEEVGGYSCDRVIRSYNTVLLDYLLRRFTEHHGIRSEDLPNL